MKEDSDTESETSNTGKIPGQSIGEVIKQELTIDQEYSEPETKCKMIDHRLYNEKSFQKKILKFAEQLISGAFLMFEFHRNPFEKDNERITLEWFFYSYIRRTKLKLLIYCSEDENTTDDDSDDEEKENKEDDKNEGTMENDSKADEPKE